MKRPRTPRGTGAAEKARQPTYDDLLAIVRLIESGSRFSEFRLRSGDIEVEVKRPNGAAPAPSGLAAANDAQGRERDTNLSQGRGGALPDLPPGTQVVRAPMVGTFYRAAEPGAAPFVEPGTRVEPDSIVCIIEVMKLMNSVAAGMKGVVTHVFVENAQMVEFAQPLIAIRPK